MLVKWVNNVYVYDIQAEQNRSLLQTESLLSALLEDGIPT